MKDILNHHTFSTILFILAALSAFYGICILSIQSGTRFFLIWFLIAGFMALCGADVLNGFLPSGIRRLLIILAVAAATGIVITWGFILSDFYAKGEDDLDVIVVLGAQVKASGPSPVLRYRLDSACAYLEKNPETRCIVSGGKGPNEPEAEAEAMKEYLLERGISEDRIEMENQSLDTAQNIAYSAEMMDTETDRIGIVTNNFHLFRALFLARRQGYRHVCGIAAPSNPFFLLNNMLRESVGIVKDLLWRE